MSRPSGAVGYNISPHHKRHHKHQIKEMNRIVCTIHGNKSPRFDVKPFEANITVWTVSVNSISNCCITVVLLINDRINNDLLRYILLYCLPKYKNPFYLFWPLYSPVNRNTALHKRRRYQFQQRVQRTGPHHTSDTPNLASHVCCGMCIKSDNSLCRHKASNMYHFPGSYSTFRHSKVSNRIVEHRFG